MVTNSALLHVVAVERSNIHPVVLIPGLQACQLQAKLVSRVAMSNEVAACKSNSDDWFTIWTDVESLLPVDCWINNMRLLYNRSTRTTHNIPGVFIKPSYFGETKSVETLSSFPLIADQIYMKPLVDRLVKCKYIRGQSIRSAPYDFRKAPNEQAAWMHRLKILIEETYFSNGNTSVDIIAHSMGGMFGYIFLTQQSSQWKNQYIHQFISIATPYGGTVTALKAQATGHNIGMIPLKDRDIHLLELSYPIVPFLLPSRIAWTSSTSLVNIASRINITIDNYDYWFQLLNIANVNEMYSDVKNLMGSFVHPGVNVTCIYSTGKQTPSKLVYQSLQHFPYKPFVEYGDGDGTVNRESLEACSQWSTENTYTVTLKNFNSFTHSEIVKAPEIIDALVSLITKYPRDS